MNYLESVVKGMKCREIKMIYMKRFKFEEQCTTPRAREREGGNGGGGGDDDDPWRLVWLLLATRITQRPAIGR